ncbi:hypothetical protein [Halorussus halophilus]|uniref:hypothetical protein n=1 Tax=Halorussus halophilus TaxID=2650975 RepID=UPI0013011918|nr:hypothetical protein [Halorussus halophilus]
MNWDSSDRNEVGYGGSRSGNSRTGNFVIANRYQKDGETWFVLSSVPAPPVELHVRQSDLQSIDG